VIRAGNGRVMIARKLGWTHMPAVVVEEDDEAAVTYAIRHNRTGELAEWDVDVLRALGDTHEIAWNAVGFDSGEISKMLAAEPPITEKRARSRIRFWRDLQNARCGTPDHGKKGSEHQKRAGNRRGPTRTGAPDGERRKARNRATRAPL